MFNDDVNDVLVAFVKSYLGAKDIYFKVSQNKHEAFGKYGQYLNPVKGAYYDKPYEKGGREYKGIILTILDAHDSKTDLEKTLKHEFLGHHGLNTLTSEVKNKVLDSLMATSKSESPELKAYWDYVNHHYEDEKLRLKAEEVFCLHVEKLDIRNHLDKKVEDKGIRSLNETCINNRKMTLNDIDNIANLIGYRLHSNSRVKLDLRNDKMKQKIPFNEQVAKKLVEQLKQGTAPWQKPWVNNGGQDVGLLPENPITGKRYKGINMIQLMMQDREDNRWMTYSQAASAGGQVRKGEKGTPIQYWSFSKLIDDIDPKTGKPKLDDRGKNIKISIPLERPIVRHSVVFNVAQIDGLPQFEKKEFVKTWESQERAEKILSNSGANINHDQNNRAFYRKSTDSIHLPSQGQFDSADKYYATALHELGHWTGHESRLNRENLGSPFGSEDYAKEELRAEISSMILGEQLGIGHDPEQHAAYVDSWISVLEDDYNEIFRASAEAEKISEYIMNLEQKQVLEKEIEMTYAEKVEQTKQTITDEQKVVAKELRKDAEYELSVVENALDVEEKRVVREELQMDVQDAKQDTREAKITVKSDVSERQYINVPFKEKDDAKALGARWDRKEQSWFIPSGVDSKPFEKWARDDNAKSLAEDNGRTYLAVPYEQRNEAKSAGARWDKTAKSWYMEAGADETKLSKWLPENVKNQQDPAMTPREEFAEAMRSLDILVEGEHPIMDGKKHRIATIDDKSGEKSGFYVGHLDGRPAGYISNNRSGAEMKWKAKGYSLDPADKAKLQAEAAAKLAQREKEQEQMHLKTAERIQGQLEGLQPLDGSLPYLDKKGIKPQSGVLVGKDDKTMFVPATDADGKVWTVQYINEDGQKRFAKESKKEGMFHTVGGLNALESAPTLVIAEGYATAASASEALGYATVAAFDAGNLKNVAIALNEKYPNKPILIIGDNDKHLEYKLGSNPGQEKAQDAAKAVGGQALMPVFSVSESEPKACLSSVTPEDYKRHKQAERELEDAPENKKAEIRERMLSEEQLKALDDLKEFTDYNDLANKSILGKEGLKSQLTAATEKLHGVHYDRVVPKEKTIGNNENLAKQKKNKVNTMSR